MKLYSKLFQNTNILKKSYPMLLRFFRFFGLLGLFRLFVLLLLFLATFFRVAILARLFSATFFGGDFSFAFFSVTYKNEKKKSWFLISQDYHQIIKKNNNLVTFVMFLLWRIVSGMTFAFWFIATWLAFSFWFFYTGLAFSFWIFYNCSPTFNKFRFNQFFFAQPLIIIYGKKFYTNQKGSLSLPLRVLWYKYYLIMKEEKT